MCGCQEDDRFLDLPPGCCFYQDEGCEFSEACLNCPLLVCVYDEPGGRRRLRNRMRAKQIARQFTTEGRGTGELAAIQDISRRTVQRALKTVFVEGVDQEVSQDG